MKQSIGSNKSLTDNFNMKKHVTQGNSFYSRSGFGINPLSSGSNGSKTENLALSSVNENNRNPIKSINLVEFAYQLANA